MVVLRHVSQRRIPFVRSNFLYLHIYNTLNTLHYVADLDNEDFLIRLHQHLDRRKFLEGHRRKAALLDY